jgi:hypothetical protein
MSVDREKILNDIMKDMISQEQWDSEQNTYIEKLNKQYSKYLEEYIPIPNKKIYNTIKLGGYIRYVNSNDEIKWGGILIKKYKTDGIDYMVLSNTDMKCITVSFYRNTIFYKPHTTASDKNRKLFISYLDTYNN